MRYIDIILPVPLRQTFTYHLDDDACEISVGCRVVVTFGGQKFVTGIVKNTQAEQPLEYTTKPIESILDEHPIVTNEQLTFWQWMADYYMCSIGEVMKAALPSGLRMENKAKVRLHPDYKGDLLLKGNEASIYYLLSDQKSIELAQISKQIKVKNSIPILRRMMEKGILLMEDDVQQKYSPKLQTYFSLAPQLSKESALKHAFALVKSAKKQQDFLNQVIKEHTPNQHFSKNDFIKKHGFSSAIYKALLEKKVICEEQKEISRFDPYTTQRQELKTLSPEQSIALNSIKKDFAKDKPCLLHGITASGKTEVYFQLIKEQLDDGKQILFLLPEIAITAEMLHRLVAVFDTQISIFHSRYSNAQRVEVWERIKNDTKGHLVIGARSALFLPFHRLGLIIVDEEHEGSYKQQDPAPNYNARDAAVMLARQMKANILLGSATPSIESAYNAQLGKYGLAHLMTRHSQVPLPEFTVINMTEAYRKKQNTNHFSSPLIEQIKATLEQKQQVILFQNRRGYSGFVECESCGYVPQCPNCDISLTYYQRTQKLACHYCGSNQAYTIKCPKCGLGELSNKGMGTEKVLEHAQALFPDKRIVRFDQDSTKERHSFDTIIAHFQDRKIDILVGTQMIAKGLDFDNVGLVAIMNADNMINFPDFRAHEKAYQLMSQVAGRAGRRQEQGKVILQSYTPDYELIKAVTSYDYNHYYSQQLEERKDFKYPPFVRLIDITIRHRNSYTAQQSARLLANKMREQFGPNVLGPEAPAISRIKLMYLQKILLKVEPQHPLQKTKNWLLALAEALKGQEAFKGLSVVFDVDI